MKVVRFAAFGVPAEVAACAEAPDPGPPADDEVVVAVEAFPINPVDLATIEGGYATRPALPATPGAEAAGRVVAAGAGAEGLREGDRVMLLSRENWVQLRKVPARQAIKLPADIDPLQAAMLKVNPATASLMLSEITPLMHGDWLIQNAANSAVGRLVIRLAAERGLHTVNVVRRDGLDEALAALGADVVARDGDDLAARVAEATGGAEPRLALDAVGGGATPRLADCLAEGATICAYGLASGEAYALEARHLLFRGLTLTGFWLVPTLGDMGAGAVAALYAGLADKVASGALATEVEATYDIDDIGEALAHAARPGRSGKVLVTPNGPV